MRKWLDKLTKLQDAMLVISLSFVWFCICYCVNWAVGDNPKSPSPSPNDIITFVTLPLTVVAIYLARKAFNAQKEALEHQQVLGAWSLLAQKGAGDLGRKDALEFLHSKGKALVGLDLSNAHLVGLKLNGADLTGCNFTGANLEYAHFEGAILISAHFDGAKLNSAHFDGAKLNSAHFEGASLYYAKFEGASLVGTHFEGASLHYAHFEGAVLYYAKFEGASLYYAKFEGANLRHARFEGVKWFETVTFKDCYVSKYSKELPTAPKGWKFEFEKKDGTQKTEVVDGLARYYIKLIKTETKNP